MRRSERITKQGKIGFDGQGHYKGGGARLKATMVVRLVVTSNDWWWHAGLVLQVDLVMHERHDNDILGSGCSRLRQNDGHSGDVQ